MQTHSLKKNKQKREWKAKTETEGQAKKGRLKFKKKKETKRQKKHSKEARKDGKITTPVSPVHTRAMKQYAIEVKTKLDLLARL